MILCMSGWSQQIIPINNSIMEWKYPQAEQRRQGHTGPLRLMAEDQGIHRTQMGIVRGNTNSV